MILAKDITIVFQGDVPSEKSREYACFFSNLRWIKKNLEDSTIILGAWRRDKELNIDLIDRIIYLDDPGELSSFKFNTKNIVNNINRQIYGANEILKLVETAYVLKLRIDCEFSHLGFLKFYNRFGVNNRGEERLVVSNFFTIDPRMFEQMPFHVSDWILFGPTSNVKKLWDISFMSSDDSTYYDNNQHATHSNFFDRRYRSRWAIEQYIMLSYAKDKGYEVPSYHNEVTNAILSSHDKFVAQEFLVLDLDILGIKCSKYTSITESSFQYFNCLNFLDWCALNIKQDNEFVLDKCLHVAVMKRVNIKRVMGLFVFIFSPVMHVFVFKPIKFLASKFFRLLIKSF